MSLYRPVLVRYRCPVSSWVVAVVYAASRVLSSAMWEGGAAESCEESSSNMPRQAAEPLGLAPAHILSNTSPDIASHHNTAL